MSDLAWLKRLTDHRLLTAREEAELGRRIQAGDPEAKRRLIEHNGRLAVSMAREFTGRGVAFEDLVQDALVGVAVAAEKFDPERGVKFSTYATWWVRRELQSGFQRQHATIRMPPEIRNLRGRALAMLGDEPDLTVVEIAERLDATALRVREALDAAVIGDSLDAGASDTEDDKYGRVGDSLAESVEEVGLHAAEASWLWHSLDGMDEVDALAAHAIYGEERNPTAVARELGLKDRYEAEAAAERGLARLQDLALAG